MGTKSWDEMGDTEMMLTASDKAANPKRDAYIIYEH